MEHDQFSNGCILQAHPHSHSVQVGACHACHNLFNFYRNFALIALESHTFNSTNSRQSSFAFRSLNHKTYFWWLCIWGREACVKKETGPYLLAFDPRWALKAYWAWITLYKKNIQNHCFIGTWPRAIDI